MKKLLWGFVFSNVFFVSGQSISHRERYEDGIGIITSIETIVPAEKSLDLIGISNIPYDTSQLPSFSLGLNYYAPVTLEKDSSDQVYFVFENGEIYNYKRWLNEPFKVAKDSSDLFMFRVEPRLMDKLRNQSLKNIRIVTNAYVQTFELNDDNQLTVAKLSNYLIDKAFEEYDQNLNFERSLQPNNLRFDASENKKLEKKWLGKFSGEWNSSLGWSEFELNITKDTSYLLWKNTHFVNDTLPSDFIIPQIVNINRTEKENQIVLEVCYDPKLPERTNGRRIFLLNLAEDGKTVYGTAEIVNFDLGYLYGKKKRK